MFATLAALPCQTSLRARLRRRFSPPTPSCSRVTLPNFFSFYHIQAPLLPDDSLPWDLIAETAGTLRTRLLLPKGVTIAADAAVRAFVPKKLPLRVLCESALHTLETLGLDPLSQSLCVVDPQGVLFDKIERFVPLAATLRVVTDDIGVYEETTAQLRARYGVSLLLSPSLDGAAESTILLLEDAADAPPDYQGMVFTNRPCRRMGAVTLSPEPITLPPEFRALCPPNINSLTFAAAAYELCAADELDNLWAPCVPVSTPAAARPADPSCPGWQT